MLGKGLTAPPPPTSPANFYADIEKTEEIILWSKATYDYLLKCVYL